jgi:intein-encoded DNA endonuclease-like protein
VFPPVPPWPDPTNAGAGGGSKGGVQEVRGMAQVPDPEKYEGEEVKKMDGTNTKKRGAYLPRELRIKIYNDAIVLRQQGRSYNEIINIIEQEYGIRLAKSTLGYWIRGQRDPYNGRYIPSLDLLEPSEELAYVIGVILGDGCVWKKGDNKYAIGLQANDKEFVKKFATCLAKVLGRKPIKVGRVRLKLNGEIYTRYYALAVSKTLYELLRKPIDLQRINKYIEHCPRCIAAFLRGLFDSEGVVTKHREIRLVNTDYELLLYVMELLRRLGIRAMGPKLYHRKGELISDPWTGKQYRRNADCYYIYIINIENLMNFYYFIGFTVKRKQKRLIEVLRLN